MYHSSIRTSSGSLCFHKVTQTCSCILQVERSKDDDLHRRCSCDVAHSSRGISTSPGSCQISPTTRIPDQLGKVRSVSSPVTGILGDDCRHCTHGNRRIQIRLGSSVRSKCYIREIFFRRILTPYQSTGAPSSEASSEDTMQKQSGHSYPSKNGQSSGSEVHQCQRRDQLTHAKQGSNPDLVLVQTTESTIQAEYLPGALNNRADAESRKKSELSDWKLNPGVFNRILAINGPLEIDLFAARHNTQLKKFISWHPDPEAQGTDAFKHNWSTVKG